MTFLNRLSALAVAGVTALALFASTANASSNSALSGLDVDTLRQSTVHIRNITAAENGTFGRSTGSGFVIDNASCLVVTNAHVVENAAFLTVFRSTDIEQAHPIRARIVGYPDPNTHNDIALLQLERCDGMPQVRLGDSDTALVGDVVVAVGSPMGLTDTVTVGVVSKNPRLGFASSPSGYIQTDADINPGNSGGPLFNDRGLVIGMNTAIISRSGGSHGLGLAIPVNVIKVAMDQILVNGAPSWPTTGISVTPLSPAAARVLGVPQHLLEKGIIGVAISSVDANSPAAAIGLTSGDVLIGIGSQDITGPLQMRQALARLNAGDVTTVTIVRNKEVETFSITLAEGFVAPDIKPAEAYDGLTGMKVMTLKEVFVAAFNESFALIPPQVRSRLESRGIDFGALAERMATEKAAAFGDMANAPVVGYIYNMGPAHAAGIQPIQRALSSFSFMQGLPALPLQDVAGFAAITGVVAEGEGFAFTEVTSTEQFEAYIARAAAAGRTVVVEFTVVTRAAGANANDNLHEEQMTPDMTAEATSSDGLRRTKVFVELQPRAAN